MKRANYFKYSKLISNRRSKDNIYLVYKSILDLFLEEDRIKIVNFLLYSSKILIIVPLFFFTVFYTFLGSLYSSKVLEGIFFSGLICLIHTFISLYSKYGYNRVLMLKKDFKFVLRIILKGKENAFIIKKINYELFTNVLIYSIFPYFLSILITFLFINHSLWILLVGVLLISLNYMWSVCLLIIKMIEIYENIVKLLLITTTSIYLLTLLSSFNIKRIFPMESQKLQGYFLDNSYPEINGHCLILISLILITLIFCSLFVYMIFKTKKIISSIFISKNEDVHKAYNNKIVYQRLLLRGFSSKNKILYIRIGSIIATFLVIVFFPILNHSNRIPLALTILFFCYTPSLFNLVITYYLYEEILQKPFTITTYYFLKKFQSKKYLYKQTILATFSQLLIVSLPLLTLLLLYRPINIFITIICYFVVFFVIITILVTRIYNLEKYNFEEIKVLDPASLTSKSFENFIVFGIPILYAIPVVSLILAQPNLIYAYMSMIGYVILLLLYCSVKVYLSLFRGIKDVKDS
ncbi:hypothetical protein ASE51_26370 [Bacillus sp. Root147]|nr:hypothetical protein ASE51_26370 [Bacillus sp. Root147]